MRRLPLYAMWLVTLAAVGAPFVQPQAWAGTTERVSLSSAGEQGNDGSARGAVSWDGQFVAFMSAASNLVADDTNGAWDIFVHDRLARTTERVSVSSTGGQGNGKCDLPAISADGRFVAFMSLASNLVPGDSNGASDIFVHDRLTGVTERVSVNSLGEQASGDSSWPSITADGRFVAFDSSAPDLVPGDSNGCKDIFVHDRSTGVTERVSVNSAGEQGNHTSAYADISADGRFVAFHSGAHNLVLGEIHGGYNIYVHDRLTGVTERVSVSSAGDGGNGDSSIPSISADGRFVVFSSWASNLVPGDTNGFNDIFVHDRLTRTTERVSVSTAGEQANGTCYWPSNISGDGRVVIFNSHASNLVPGDTNGCMDIFARDRLAGTTERVSVSSADAQANAYSDQHPGAVSGDGRFVAFECWASNLVLGDTNGCADVMVRDRLPNTPPTANAGPDLTIHWTAQISTVICGQANDPDPNTALTYRWLDITDAASPIVLLDWSPAGPAGEADLDLGALPALSLGTQELQLEVSDGEATAADSMLLIVTNGAPTVDAGGNVMIASQDQALTVLLGSACDPDSDSLSYRWADVTGGGYMLLLDWTPTGPAGEAHLDLGLLDSLPVGQYTLRLETWDGLEYGQDEMLLTVENSPPDAAMTGCGTYRFGLDSILVGGAISDFDGDLVSWEIQEGATVLDSGQVQPPAGGEAVDIPLVDLSGVLDIGAHRLVLAADDGANLAVTEPCTVSVIDVQAPSVVPIPSVSQLWPPNHLMVPITIAANAYDDSGGPVYLDVSVISSEPADGTSDGSTVPDSIIDGIQNGPGGMVYLHLRAERAGKGPGRTYTVTIIATDGSGNSSSAQVQVIAPHDKGKK